VLLYAVSIVLAFGYEVFSFNLTVDEEITPLFTRWERIVGSVSEGRWTLATLTSLLPNTVSPVVSTALGVGLSAICWWVIARRYLGLSPWRAAITCSVAGTFPVLAFLFSFSTIAWVMGVGAVLSLGFAAGTSSPRWRGKLLGVLAGAAAIGVYDSFVIVIALVALAIAARAAAFRPLIEGIVAVVAALLASRLIGLLYSLAFGVPPGKYTAGFLDLPGFASDPIGRSATAVHNVYSTFTLSSDRFGLSSPMLALFTLVLVVGAVVAIILDRRSVGSPVARSLALLAMLLAPVVVEAISVVVVMRSMLYLPMLIIAVGSIAFSRPWAMTPTLRKSMVGGLAALAILAVIANSIIVNRLFSTAATTYALDRQLAVQIGQEKDILLGGNASKTVPIVVQGLHGWPDGAFTTVHETIGLSFFELNEKRTQSFLADHGVAVREATTSEHKRAEEALEDMPAYPEPGWIALDGGVLILKVSDEP
jgi:hypothetical protein